MGHESCYLRDVLGDVLSDALAETVLSEPDDPIDYLGTWLLKCGSLNDVRLLNRIFSYVSTAAKTDHLRKDYFKYQPRALEETRQAIPADEDAIKKNACLQQIAESVENESVTDVYALWNVVVDRIIHFTSIKAAYIAIILPERSNPCDVDTAHEEITDDEPLFHVNVDLNEETEETTQDKETESSDDEHKPNAQTYIEFVAAANTDQRFLLHKTLHRSTCMSPDQGEEEATPTANAPVFRLIDENLSELYVRYCINEPGMEFVGAIPKVGSCYLSLLKAESESTQSTAVLICDTLSPPGSGGPIAVVDQAFIRSLAHLVSQLIPRLLPQSQCKDKGTKEWLSALRSEILEIYQEQTNTEETEKNEASTNDENDTKEEDSADEMTRPILEDIKSITEELKEIESKLMESNESKRKESKILEIIRHGIDDEKDDILTYLKKETCPERTTLSLIQTAFQLFGNEKADSQSWSCLREVVLEDLFPLIASFKCKEADCVERWKATMSRLACLKPSTDALILDEFLYLFLKQACRLRHCEEKQAIIEEIRRAKEAELETKREALASVCRSSENEAVETVIE